MHMGNTKGRGPSRLGMGKQVHQPALLTIFTNVDPVITLDDIAAYRLMPLLV